MKFRIHIQLETTSGHGTIPDCSPASLSVLQKQIILNFPIPGGNIPANSYCRLLGLDRYRGLKVMKPPALTVPPEVGAATNSILLIPLADKKASGSLQG